MLYGALFAAMYTDAALEIITMSPRGRVRIDGITSFEHIHGAERVRVPNALELGRIGVGDRLAARCDARVVHENVDRAEVCEHLRDHLLARGPVVDRRRIRDRAPAELLDLGDRFVRGFVVLAVVDRDVGAVGGEPERDRLADAPARRP